MNDEELAALLFDCLIKSLGTHAFCNYEDKESFGFSAVVLDGDYNFVEFAKKVRMKLAIH